MQDFYITQIIILINEHRHSKIQLSLNMGKAISFFSRTLAFPSDGAKVETKRCVSMRVNATVHCLAPNKAQ